MTFRAAAALVVGAALLTGARVASASDEFLGPTIGLGWRGTCIICHSGDIGSAGTATQKFAQSLMDKGLRPTDIPSLNAAFAALGPGDDSDKDGTSDLEELMMGTNPNVANGGAVEPNEPVLYGIQCALGRGDVPTDGAPMFAGLLTALALWRTRRRAVRLQ